VLGRPPAAGVALQPLRVRHHARRARDDPRDQSPLAKIVVPASLVDKHLPEDGDWTTLDRDHRETTEEYCQRAWSRFIDPIRVGEMA
jgi:hypothetical protein